MAADDDRLTPDEDRGVLQTLFGAAVFTYGEMLSSGDFAGAPVLCEQLAEYWRVIAEGHRLEQLGDDFLSGEALELLAALESSLILASDPDPERQALMLSDEEFGPRMLRVGAEGIWSDWDERLDEAWREQARREAGPDSSRPPDWPPVPPPTKHPRRSDKAVRRSVWAEMDERVMATNELYEQVNPDGRPLSAAQRTTVFEHLRADAAFSRRLDRAAASLSRGDWGPAQLTLSFQRSLNRSLVLALSDDPERRRLAMRQPEVRGRAWVLQERVKGASWEQALARVQAITEAAAADGERAGGG